MQKTEPKESVAAIVVGGKDSSGNKVTDVLARGNEYAIYEIDTKDVQRRLRVLIDGFNDESEKRISDAYAKVKGKYLEAKGLLYRSDEYKMFQNRVAHTLATALSGHTDAALEQFELLINNIRQEYDDKYFRRIFYISPGYMILTLLIALIAMIDFGVLVKSGELFFWLEVVTVAVIGGVLSLTLNLPKIRFETEVREYIFFVFGLERVSISILSGLVCTFGIKSKLILSGLLDGNNVWGLLFIVIISAFSEKFVPNIIMKVEESSVDDKKGKLV